jgi:hypothetical protein
VAGLPLSPDAAYAFAFTLAVAAALLGVSFVAFASFVAGLSASSRPPSALGAACRGALVAVAFCVVADAVFSRTSFSVALLLSLAALILISLAASGALRGHVP